MIGTPPFHIRFTRRRRLGGAVILLVAIGGLAFGQFRRGGERLSENVRTAREIPSRSTGTPMWDNPPTFAADVFTFTRLRYGNDRGDRGAGGGSWMTDLPDADLNLSYRLQQMTSMKVDPHTRILRANDPELLNYPFLMTAAAGAMVLDDDEVQGLRRYLLNGGFFLLTDFWGDREWDYFAGTMKRVLPEYAFVELPLEHPIYHCLFQIRAKNQVPRINFGLGNLANGSATWERGPDGREVHHRAIFDAKGRLMVLALHNSDDSDGWEREGEDTGYFHKFAEGMAYPLAINIIFYVMTH
ncbi:MAG: DUF4159 domain-containing protein [Opitutaceae bacterium]